MHTTAYHLHTLHRDHLEGPAQGSEITVVAVMVVASLAILSFQLTWAGSSSAEVVHFVVEAEATAAVTKLAGTEFSSEPKGKTTDDW